MARAIGIDLGTTNSAATAISRGRPRVLTSSVTGADWTPSLVARTDGSFVVGSEAETMAQAGSVAVAHSIKRLIGRRFDDEEVQRMIGEHRFLFTVVEHPDHAGEIGVELDDVVLSPSEVSAQVLTALRHDAEAELGEKVGHAVITVPAYFRDPSILATREAGRIAGLRVHHVMPEPTAAALAYALGEDADAPEVRHILVYDFGGGTFDVSVLLAVPSAPLQVLAVDGDNFLGGDDIDWEIARRWDAQLKDEHRVSAMEGTGIALNGPYPPLAVRWALKVLARETKERLAGTAPSRSVTKPGLILRDDGTMVSPTFSLSRDELASIASAQVDRTFAVVERALAAAQLRTEDIHDVVVVGGSTRLSGVLDQLRLMFPQAAIRNSINPMLVVAIGASQQTRAALPWHCLDCGRVNEAVSDRCIGCGAEPDRETHDCEACGAIYGPTDSVCPNPACQTRIIRPDAPVEVLSHSFKLQIAGGEWHTLIERGTPVHTASRVAAEPSAWQTLHVTRNGQRVDLPIGQDHDDHGKPPSVIAHFTVADPPGDLVAGEPINVRLLMDGDRVSSAQAEIRGQLYPAAERADFRSGGDAPVSGEQADAQTPNAEWYRFLAWGADSLPDSTRNPGARDLVTSLKAAAEELNEIADRMAAAEKAGDEAAVGRLESEATSFVETRMSFVPSLSMAMYYAHAVDDLDTRRDLQTAIEGVRSSLATGGGDVFNAAVESLFAVVDSVQLPDSEESPDHHLLSRLGRK